MRILGAASAAATLLPAFAAMQQAGAAAQPASRRGMADMGEMRVLSPDTVIISSSRESAWTGAVCALGDLYHSSNRWPLPL